ncbi:MAG: hypothetical protein ACOX7F_05555 [Eubacteriales bacterium]
MLQTSHYNLKMPELNDFVDVTVLNENMETLDQAVHENRVVVGSYTGDGTASREIVLGFAPRAVYLCDHYGCVGDGLNHNNLCGGLALQDVPVFSGDTTVLSLTQNGFMVYGNTSKPSATPCSNSVNLSPFRYVAWP